jgi:hypothetical protein
MQSLLKKSLSKQSFSKTIALLCLLLTFVSAAALITHHHTSATDALKCTVCVTAHASSPKAVATLPNRTFVRASAVRMETVSAKQRLVTFALSVRPPPAV